jgi:hypothetical protein
MITLEQHIHELQQELRHCYMTHQERAETEAELAKSIAELVELERESDSVFDIPQREFD